MKELALRFESLRANHPLDGDYILLCRVIKKRGYSDAIIKKAFDKFVLDCPKYNRTEKEMYVKYLRMLTLKN